ncbi:hypothetical protein ACJX0J_030922, partial [Zea mays]
NQVTIGYNGQEFSRGSLDLNTKRFKFFLHACIYTLLHAHQFNMSLVLDFTDTLVFHKNSESWGHFEIWSGIQFASNIFPHACIYTLLHAHQFNMSLVLDFTDTLYKFFFTKILYSFLVFMLTHNLVPLYD